MSYTTLIVNISKGIHNITLNRLKHRNSINKAMLVELNLALDIAENDSSCKLIVIEGQNGTFCTGMDFTMFASDVSDAYEEEADDFSVSYMNTLKRLTLSPKIILSKVDGQVMAGGVGLVAASDIVLSTNRTKLSLSEALWGLLPAMVTPYLIRKVGFQKAYYMTLTSMPVTANEARDIHLIDVVDDDIDTLTHHMSQRLSRLDESTIREMKQYFRDMWIITEQMEKKAVEKINYLASKKEVLNNITNYVRFGRFPWEK